MINRRQLLKHSAAAAAALSLSPWLQPFAIAEDAPKKKVLFFTKSAGFQHSVITRTGDDPDELSYAEKIFKEEGEKAGYDVTCSKDGEMFGQNLDQFDVFAFYTTGDLTKQSDKYMTRKDERGKDAPDLGKPAKRENAMSTAAKDAFLAAISSGKGFIGFHCAADTFHSPQYAKGGGKLPRYVDENGKDEFDPYIQMLGGEFVIHGKQQKATLKTIDANFPGASALNDAKFDEEWYSLNNFANDLHVILAQDCTGMDGAMYQRAMYPETWARMHGKGRVFYTSMGHREDVWKRDDFLALIKNALAWTSGKAEADVTPNIAQATPGANVPKEPAKS